MLEGTSGGHIFQPSAHESHRVSLQTKLPVFWGLFDPNPVLGFNVVLGVSRVPHPLQENLQIKFV